LFFVIHENKIYVSVSGLSFSDIIYADEFVPDPIHGAKETFDIRVEQDYLSP